MRHECIIRMVLLLGLLVGIAIDLAYSEPRFGTIKGTVVSELTGDPVGKASVRLDPAGKTTTTDARGRFEFSNLPQGVYSIRVSHPNFTEKQVSNITTRPGETVEIQVRLGRSALPPPDSAGILNKFETAQRSGEQQKSSAADTRILGIPDALSSSALDAFVKSAPAGQPDYKREVYVPKPERDQVYVTPPQDMFFRDYGTNQFVQTSRDRFSTFAVDVDDASYNLARQYLIDGHMPPNEAIRVEEFVNHFDYGYAEPADGRFRIFTELTSSPFDRRTYFMKIGVMAKEIAEERRKPLNLTIVLDVSGSMGYDNRFDLVKRSLDMLLAQLDGGDRVGVVAYGSSAHVVLEPTSGDQTRRIQNAVHRLVPGGSTYAEAGLKLGFQMANRQLDFDHSNLVILCSDGVANVGQTSPDAIMREIKRFAGQGITLSTFGFGMGNYNDVLLERLAQQGNGRYAYVNDVEQARTLFLENIMGTLQVVARDVKVQVEFNPSTVSSYRLLGYENRAVPDQKFRDNRQDGGEVGSGHEVTALYELVLQHHSEEDNLATVFVRWKNPSETRVTEVSRNVDWEQRAVRFAGARPELRLAIVAAKFAELLKQTGYSESLNFRELLDMARSVNRQLNTEQTRDLVELTGRADNLSGYLSDYRRLDDNYDDDDD